MNYEEKYKEALERAKKLHDSYNLMHISVDEIEQIFPELAESEDERIMSRIIDGFKNFSRSASKWNNIPVEEVIACLEKQEEQKQEWSEDDSDILRDAICATDILAKDFKKDNPHLAKTLRVAKEWLESLPERFTLPIKQEWDEFNENCLKRAIWYVENPAPSVVKDTNLVLWLKSLRPSWKPSEEQMKALLNIEGDLRAFQYNDKAKIIAELYEQLKRL